MTSRLRADLALVGVAAVWGATFVMVKDALDSVGPLWFLAVRFGIAALMLLPFAARYGARPHGSTPRAGLLLGVFLFAGYAFQTAGLQFTSASRAGFITGLSVVLVPLGAALWLRTRPSAPVMVGLGCTVAGLGLLSLQAEDLTGLSLGDLLVLACAVSFAGHILLTGQLARYQDPLWLTFGQIAAAAVLSIVLAVAAEPVRTAGLIQAAPAAVFTAALATVGAFYVQTRAQRHTSATHTALIFALEPVCAALFAYAFAGERLGPPEIAGCALILLGMVTAELRR